MYIIKIIEILEMKIEKLELKIESESWKFVKAPVFDGWPYHKVKLEKKI